MKRQFDRTAYLFEGWKQVIVEERDSSVSVTKAENTD